MNRNFLRFTALLLTLLLLIPSVTSCKEDEIEDLLFSNDTQENPDDVTPAGTYELSFTSYGDGTCAVSGITFSEDAKNLAVVIPESSPAGDTVVAYTSRDLSFQCVPRMITGENFREKIEKPLLVAVEAGELEEFTYKKAMSYFLHMELTDNQTPNAQKNMIAQYPLVQATDLYVFATDATESEFLWITGLLMDHTDYSAAENKRDTEALLELGQKNNIPNYDQGIMLPKRSDAVLTVSFPATLTQIAAYAFVGCSNLRWASITENLQWIGNAAFSCCKKLALTEYENGLYLGTESNPYFALVSIPNESLATALHDQVVTVTLEVAEIIGQRKASETALNGVLYAGTASNPYLIALRYTNENGSSDAENASVISIAPSCRIMTDLRLSDAGKIAAISIPAEALILSPSLVMTDTLGYGLRLQYHGSEAQWNTLVRNNHAANGLTVSPEMTVEFQTGSHD